MQPWLAATASNARKMTSVTLCDVKTLPPTTAAPSRVAAAEQYTNRAAAGASHSRVHHGVDCVTCRCGGGHAGVGSGDCCGLSQSHAGQPSVASGLMRRPQHSHSAGHEGGTRIGDGSLLAARVRTQSGGRSGAGQQLRGAAWVTLPY